MSGELEVLKAVARRLDSVGIPYMVTGSVAVNYDAVPRMTRDIEVVVELSGRDAEQLREAFQDDFYVDRDAVRRAIEERDLFNLIHGDSVIKVGFVRKDSQYRQEEFARRRAIRVEAQELSLATPEDLIISKLDWARQTRSEVQRPGRAAAGPVPPVLRPRLPGGGPRAHPCRPGSPGAHGEAL